MPPRSRPKRKLSVLKRARQEEKRTLRNKTVRSKVKTLSTRVRDAAGAKDKEALEGALKNAIKAISSAASKGVVHKNTASRKISKLSKSANSAVKTA